MLIRIVKMGFYKQNIESFLSNFNESKQQIRNFEGCQLLELYRDKNDPTVFFTYSHWDNEEHLELYRKSKLFYNVWSKTKPLFSKPAKAWSVERLEKLE
ncbi:antibiotic biosynthesis monooxygenase [Sabulilitoribacter multivorans]|uniref:Antibiotic biosynthesis monooxygenase n=1 Tax=Flaviramulus multivorans TaxID=1304750 RepID=A0ABS9IMJ5_9FLAO|nr:antibiotic biosynthesis monooxygenase [Flaviramulus multivorans]MCF7561815.1 antibiotic biosynthesis monooxygenase [Flaviramulus multivorans]